MYKICLFLLLILVLSLTACEVVMTPGDATTRDHPDRASLTPCGSDGCPQPTFTPLPGDWPTNTPNPDQLTATAFLSTPQPTPDDRTAIPTVDDGGSPPTYTPFPPDYPTGTLNPDQIYLTALAGTLQPTVDISAGQTHEAGGGN